MSQWSVFQDLYDSEINITISTFWDGGFFVQLGDEMNGFKAEHTFYHFVDIEPWVVIKAIELWPYSTFAKRYKFIDYCRELHAANQAEEKREEMFNILSDTATSSEFIKYLYPAWGCKPASTTGTAP